MNPTSYTIQSGDTLSGIAQKFGVSDYNTIAKANNISNPNLIIAGHTLTIPGMTPTAGPAAAPTAAPAPVSAPNPSQSLVPTQPQQTGGLTADLLRSKFGFNDPNVINGILNDPAQVARYTQEAGLGSGAGATPSAPAPFDLVGATSAAYNTPDIQAGNKAIDDANNELTTRQKALADAQAGINDNPFYSEATRVGKSQKLTEQANNDMTVIQNKVTQAQNKVASLKADAAIKVNAALGQYNINRQSYQDTLSQFNQILSAGGLTYASPEDLMNYAASTGMSMSVLQSIQKQEQDAQVKTQIVTSTDDQGNVTLTAVDSKTGKIITQTTAGDIGPAKKGTGTTATTKKEQVQNTISQVQQIFSGRTGPQGYVSKEDWNKIKANALDAGDGSLTAREFDLQFGHFMNPDKNAAKAGYVYN